MDLKQVRTLNVAILPHEKNTFYFENERVEELCEAKYGQPVTSHSLGCGCRCLNITTDSQHSVVVELKYGEFGASFR